MMHWTDNGWEMGWGMMLGMGIAWLLVLALLGLAVAALVKNFLQHGEGFIVNRDNGMIHP